MCKIQIWIQIFLRENIYIATRIQRLLDNFMRIFHWKKSTNEIENNFHSKVYMKHQTHETLAYWQRITCRYMSLDVNHSKIVYFLIKYQKKRKSWKINKNCQNSLTILEITKLAELSPIFSAIQHFAWNTCLRTCSLQWTLNTSSRNNNIRTKK